MNVSTMIGKYRFHSLQVMRWRYNSGIMTKLILSLSFALLTGLMARVSFYLPWTPVPVTGQTFAVLMSGLLLGRWGAASQALYIVLAMTGIPWLAGGVSAQAMGPTSGYLAGFIISSYVIGYCADRYEKMRNIKGMIVLMTMANFLIIHVMGLFFLWFWVSTIQGKATDIYSLILMGSIPFIPGDMIKIIFASLISSALLPKFRYDE